MRSAQFRVTSLAILALAMLSSLIQDTRAEVVSSELAWQHVRPLTAWIDEHLAARWENDEIVPAQMASDSQWLRRVYLDLTGVIPSVWEVRALLANEDAGRYEQVVDRLLASPAHATHFAREMRRVLLPEAEANRNLIFTIFGTEQWLRNQFAAGRPYDEIVRDILVCDVNPTGTPQRSNQRTAKASPIGFYTAKFSRAENLAAGTARQFLGVRLECAQCHDHPFAEWKRVQFWQLAAFFASIKRDDPSNDNSRVEEDKSIHSIVIEGTEQEVEALFLDSTSPAWESGDDGASPRELLARWVTSPDNPYFARATVNRLWANLFGTGLVDPVDDFDPQNPASHPKLLDRLASEFVEQGYNQRFILRSLVLSRAYRLSSEVSHDSQTNARHFAVMPLRSLTADQFLASIDRATGTPPDDMSRNPYGSNAFRIKFREMFKNHDEKSTDYESSPIQALALMNGPIIAQATDLQNSRTFVAVAEYPGMSTADRIETLYLATLSREPRDDERQRLAAYVEDPSDPQGQRAALADVFWVLLNSSEFAFNH